MLLPSHVQQFADLFLNRWDTVAEQQADGRYQRVYRRFSSELIARHLLGAVTLAVDAVDRYGWARWVCLDSDAPDGLAQLGIIQDAFADVGLVNLREQSRRGGHLWLFCAERQPALLLRELVADLLAYVREQGKLSGALEIYPNTDMPTGVKGVSHPVRLPLSIHQQTRQRYAFVDRADRPCHRLTPEDGLAWLLGQQHITAQQIRIAMGILERASQPEPDPLPPLRSSATYGVIRWANTDLDLPAIIERTRPGVALRATGRGCIGWCPWHDDEAPQVDGRPGTPSLYVVRDSRYGWSWRCLSTNCGAYLDHKLYHTFDWLVWHCVGDVSQAVALARDWQKGGIFDG